MESSDSVNKDDSTFESVDKTSKSVNCDDPYQHSFYSLSNSPDKRKISYHFPSHNASKLISTKSSGSLKNNGSAKNTRSRQKTPQYFHSSIQASQMNADLKKFTIRHSKRLPYWLWCLIAKFLAIKLQPDDKPWIGTILYVNTLIFALGFAICHTWIVSCKIQAHSDNSEILGGAWGIIMVIMWCVFGVYANSLAFKLFSHPKFLETVRLHSKTIFKVNAALLLFISMSLFVFLYNWQGFYTFGDEHCTKVHLNPLVCKIVYISRVGFSAFALIWHCMVGVVFISVCRTHVIVIRRFIKKLEEDSSLIEKRSRKNLSYYVDDEFIWDTYQDFELEDDILSDENSDLDIAVLSQANFESLEKEIYNSMSVNELTQLPPSSTPRYGKLKKTPKMADLRNGDLENSLSLDSSALKPHIMTTSELLSNYWKIVCSLRSTSLVMQRWLASCIILTFMWCCDYLVFFLHNDGNILDILLFIIPLLQLPLLCSAVGEVNFDGERLIRCMCPIDERLMLMFYLKQVPLVMTVFNFPITYGAIVTAITALAVAIASRVIIDGFKKL